jgi:hypothetical protein
MKFFSPIANMCVKAIFFSASGGFVLLATLMTY